jgi:hypothetical protein
MSAKNCGRLKLADAGNHSSERRASAGSSLPRTCAIFYFNGRSESLADPLMATANVFKCLMFDRAGHCETSLLVVRFQFTANDAHAAWGLDPDLHAITSYLHDGNRDVVANANLFPGFAAEN